MSELKINGGVNSYDIDGVITVGITPRPEDIIITGRSYEEAPETLEYLHSRGIYNQVFFNPQPFEDKTRESSGKHKANILKALYFQVDKHFEDDEIQKAEIEKVVDIPVVLISHNLTNKENERHLEW